MMRNYLFIALFAAFCPALVFAEPQAGGVAWEKWSTKAFQRASEENRLVLLDLSAEWCAFCKKMDATTWRDTRVLELIRQHYVPMRIEDEVQPALAEQFRRYGRPAVVIFDHQGEELVSKKGYLKPQWMAWMLEAVVQEHQLAAAE